MEITIYQIHNVLRTYSNLLKTRPIDTAVKDKTVPVTDRVTISKEAREEIRKQEEAQAGSGSHIFDGTVGLSSRHGV